MIERIDFTKLPAMISCSGLVKYFWETTLDKNTACNVLPDYVHVGELKPLNSTIKKGDNNEKIINIGNDNYFLLYNT